MSLFILAAGHTLHKSHAETSSLDGQYQAQSVNDRITKRDLFIMTSPELLPGYAHFFSILFDIKFY